MKLAEIKNVGAFTKSLQKMMDNMSLGDVKNALRASKSKSIDKDCAKELAFASSYRRHNAELQGSTLACTLELGQGQKMDIVFKMSHGTIVVASLQRSAEASKEDDAAK